MLWLGSSDVVLRTASDGDGSEVGHLIKTEHAECQLLVRCKVAGDVDCSRAVAHRGLAQDVVAGIGDGGHSTVAVADGQIV